MDTKDLVKIFGILSDATRLAIVQSLRKQASNVTALCELLSLPQPTISHHLSIMRMSGIVEGDREGKQVIYRVTMPVVMVGKDKI